MKLRHAVLSVALACALAAPASTAAAGPKGPPPAATPSTTEVSDPATGKLGVPPPGMGQIVFFRPSKWGGGAVAFTAKENDRGVFKLGNGSYAIVVTEPGRHVYTIKSETTDTFTIEVDEGETYYVIETLTSGLVLWKPHLTPSDEATFRSVVAKLRVSQWRPTEEEPAVEAAAADDAVPATSEPAAEDAGE